MPADTTNDIIPNAIRTGALPTIDVVASGLNQGILVQPAWFRITEALVKWLRFHFSSATRIEHPNLTDRVWTADPSSPIFISSLAEFAPNESQQRPAILVDRLDQDKDMALRSIGDQKMGALPGSYGHFMQGRHVVHCLGGLEGETEVLAMEVWRELLRFAPVLRARLCLTALRPMRVGKRVQLPNHPRLVYTVPIEVLYGYEEAWALRVTDESEVNAINAVLASI